jgi:hypothetical protein
MTAPADDERQDALHQEPPAERRTRLQRWFGDGPVGQTPYSGRWLLWLVLVTVLLAGGLVILLLIAIF